MGLFAEVVTKWFKYLWIKSSKNQNMLRGFGAFGILGKLRLSSPFSQQYKHIQKRNINIVLSVFYGISQSLLIMQSLTTYSLGPTSQSSYVS